MPNLGREVSPHPSSFSRVASCLNAFAKADGEMFSPLEAGELDQHELHLTE